MQAPAGNGSSEAPLCVDLDDTLLRTDLLYESLLLLALRAPSSLLRVPLWLWQGRASLKRRLTEQAIDVARLPFRADLLEYLRAERARGRRLVLVTATDRHLAHLIQEHLQLFDEVLGSDGAVNLKGPAKARILEDRFGKAQFDYAGDSRADLHVWRSARRAVVISDSARFIAGVKSIIPVTKTFPKSTRPAEALFRACRPHQWAKNLLVLVPIVTAHRMADFPVVLAGILAFISFSLLASSVYLWNDMLDLESDRGHATKRNRPLAAGQVSIPAAAALASLLLLAGLAVGALTGPGFLLIAGIYLVSNFAYSTWLKRVVMLDVVILACFYTLRLLGGGAATGIGVSDWLLAFSVFFFFGLAMVKRYQSSAWWRKMM